MQLQIYNYRSTLNDIHTYTSTLMRVGGYDSEFFCAIFFRILSQFTYRFILHTNHEILIFICQLADSGPKVVANFSFVPEYNDSSWSKTQKVVNIVFALKTENKYLNFKNLIFMYNHQKTTRSKPCL